MLHFSYVVPAYVCMYNWYILIAHKKRIYVFHSQKLFFLMMKKKPFFNFFRLFFYIERIFFFSTYISLFHLFFRVHCFCFFFNVHDG